VGHVAHVEEIRNAYSILVEDITRLPDHLGDLYVGVINYSFIILCAQYMQRIVWNCSSKQNIMLC
jgi:hypothetical protein